MTALNAGRLLVIGALWLALLPTAGAREFVSVLVATPALQDGVFDRSVVLVIRHGKMRNLLGVILNRPLNKTLGDIVRLDEDNPMHNTAVYNGGPVAPDALVAVVACEGRLRNALAVADGIYVTLDLAEVETRWDELKVSNIRIYRGYAGWAPGQLENELRLESWKYEPLTGEQLFLEDTRKLWQRLQSQTVAAN